MSIKQSIRRLVATLGVVTTVCLGVVAPAYADVELPSGTVAGLPESIVIMDSDGNSVDSQTGEYFFLVEDMQPYTTYTKDIQIINLREDKAYHIYFYAQPVSSSGTLDLENECTAVLSLNDKTVYTGKVTGEGSTNLNVTPIDLGLYTPNQSSILNCKITWNAMADVTVDHGSRLIDLYGVHTIREGVANYAASGEVTFRWIFYAVLDEEYTPPKTGILDDEDSNWLYLAILAVCTLLILCVLVLIALKKRRIAKGNQP